MDMLRITDSVLYWVVYTKGVHLSVNMKEVFQEKLLGTLITSPLEASFDAIVERLSVYLQMLSPLAACDYDALDEWCGDSEMNGSYAPLTDEMIACFLAPTSSLLYNRCFGCALASLAQQKLETIPRINTEATTDDRLCRIRYLAITYSRKCTYERTGDKYIHGLLRSKLHCWRAMLLPITETPYDSVSDQFGADANDIVRPFFEIQPSTRMDNTTWTDNRDRDFIHFLVGVVREIIDFNEFPVYSNLDIMIGIASKKPFMFTIDSSLLDLGIGSCAGVGFDGNLHILSGSKCFALDIIWLFVSLSAPGCKSLSDLRCALDTPDLLDTHSTFYAFVEDLKELSGTSL